MTKKLLVALLVFVLAFSLVALAACGSTSIADIKANGEKDATYTFEGVVFAKDSAGFYVNQDNGSLYVVADQQVAVGDLVSVKGTLELQGSYKKPVIKATKVSVKKSGQTPLAPTASTIEDVLGVTANRNGFYGYVTVAGFVRVENNTYSLALGDNSFKIPFTADSNAYLAEWVDKQVDATVVVTNFSGTWQITAFAAEDIVKHATDIDQVKDEIFEWVDIQVADEVYFTLSLPTSYALEGNVEFAWSVTSGTSITVENNVATVNATASEVVTLQLTLSADGKTATQTFDVQVTVPTASTFADAKLITDESIVTVTGTVLTASHSSGGSRHSVVLFNESNELIQVSVEDSANFAKGDTVVAVGTWVVDDYNIGYFHSVEASVKAKAVEGYTTNIEGYNVVTLATQDDYNAFLPNWKQYAAAGTIVKIVNPYVAYSGNTSYNFIRFGYDTEAYASTGYSVVVGEGETAVTYSRIFCFQRDAFGKAVPYLEEALEVPFLQANAAEQREITFYAIPLYAGADTLQFSIIDSALIEADKQGMVEDALNVAFPTSNIAAKEAGTLTLPTSLVWTNDIVWTTNAPEFIDVTTGNYVALTENLPFTLTATYTIDGVETSTTLSFTAVAVDPQPYTLAAAKEASAEELLFNGVKGYIAAFGTDANNTTGSSYAGHYFFVYITDGTNVYSYYPQAWKESVNAEGKTVKGSATPTLNGVELKLYDEIVITKAALNHENGAHIITGEFGEVLSSDNTIDYTNLAVDATITSEEDLVAWAAATPAPVGGLVLKFTGKFYMVGSGSGNGEGCRWQVNFRAATGSSAAQYTFNLASNAKKSLSIKGCNGMLIDEWWAAAGMPQASGSTCFPVSGTFYAVTAEIAGNTFWAINLINADGFDIHEWTAAEKAEDEVPALGTELTPSTEGYTLPTSTTNATNITWEVVTSMEGLSIAEGVLSYPSVKEDTVVTLKATYTVGEATYTANVEFTLKAKVVPVTNVADTLALENGSDVKVEGVIGSFGAQTSSGEGAGFQRGVVLTDGTNVLYVSDLGTAFRNAEKQYVVGETALAIGQTIQVVGTITDGVVEPTNVTVVNAEATTPSWKAANVTINNNDELAAYQPNAKIGDVVRFVATSENPIFCQGTGTSNGGNGSNWIWTYNNSDATGSGGAKYNSIGFSTKGGSQEYTWGANWWVEKCGLPSNGIAPANNPINTHGYTGEFTVVVTAVSSSYVQMVGISASTFQLTKIVAAA